MGRENENEWPHNCKYNLISYGCIVANKYVYIYIYIYIFFFLYSYIRYISKTTKKIKAEVHYFLV